MVRNVLEMLEHSAARVPDKTALKDEHMYFAPVAAAGLAAAIMSAVRSWKFPMSETQNPGLIHEVSAMAHGGFRFSTK